MTANNASSIRNWIKTMGFKLYKSHLSSRDLKRIRYYTLDNFGVYEETPLRKTDGKASVSGKNKRFISWTPWGDLFEIRSVRDISKAYADFTLYNPNIVAG
jgi:hypothetical protein